MTENTEQIQLLKRKRATLRTSVTKLIAKIESEVKKTEVTDESEIELSIEQLNDKFDSLKVVDSDLEKILPYKELDKELESAEEYREKIITWRFKANKYLRNLNQNKNKAELGFPTGNSNPNRENKDSDENKSNHKSPDSPNQPNNNEVEINEQTLNVKLPLLTIEKFNGDPCDFQRFWDQYEAAIHKNPGLSNVEKFNYLKTYLIGNAASSIKGYSLTNGNYEAAIDTIKERFGKKQIVINSHLTKLLSLTPVKKSSDVVSLRKLFDTCKTEIRNLESLGIKVENYSALLTPILVRLLPADMILEVTKKCASDEQFMVTPILEYLSTEIISREKSAAIIASHNFSHPPDIDRPTRDRQASKHIPTASGLLNESNAYSKQNKSYLFSHKHPSAESEVNVGKSVKDRRFEDSSFHSKQTKCCLCNNMHALTECEVFKNKTLNDKKDILKRFGCCYVCLKFGHIGKFCRKFIKCEGCSRRHLRIMCPDSNNTKSEDNDESTSLSNKTCNHEVLLQTLTLYLHNGSKHIKIRGLFDSGSQHSYISKHIVNKMGYESIGQEKMTHGLFGGIQETHLHKRYRIYLSDLDQIYKCNFEVFDQEKICVDIPRIRSGPWIKEAKKYGIKFSDYQKNMGFPKNECEQEINLLIGADVCGKLLTGKIRQFSSGLVAVQTRLGWSLMGKTNLEERIGTTNVVLSLHASEVQLTDLWRLDTLGILDPSTQVSREELEKAAEEHFKRNIKVNEEGRYEVSLPWVEGHPPLSNSRIIAERRLKNCVESLRKSGHLEDYEAVFKEWEHEGIIEEVELSNRSEDEFFLPHRAVVKENSTTRIRPVYDGSARERGSPSINDCLEKGPNLVELIPSLINRFRLRKIGVIADIKKAFLQISLNKNDRRFLRFLWWEKGKPENLKTFQHRRVVFGLTCSPYLLGATLKYHLENTPELMKETADKLSESFYVDNCITSVDSEDELEKFISESKSILSNAKFDLRGWEHNSCYPNSVNILPGAKEVSVLGLIWNVNNDYLTVDLREHLELDSPVTKRKILSLVHKIFDPIGFTSPLTLEPKVLLQECWKIKVSWDTELPPSIANKFKKWVKDIAELRNIGIPRCLVADLEKDNNLTLHVFCDASKKAYATCIFLRSQTDSSVSCQLIQARCRLAPLKSVTIPRLELLACTIGARLAKRVKDDLRLNDTPTFYWSDSSNALYWIKRNDNWAPFVYNRVQEIRAISLAENWYYVPGSLNPADLPSRGCSVASLKQLRWWEGPRWLEGLPEFWPKGKIDPDYEIIDSERRKSVVAAITISTGSLKLYEETSSYLKMIKVTAWIYRFFRNTKSGQKKNLEKNLSAEEIVHAEHIVLRYAQKGLLEESKPCYTSLETVCDEIGLIRVKTRITMRKDSRSFRYPIVLPFDNNITRSIILEKHKELSHAGIQIVMSVLRERFWILRCRRTVRQVLKRCIPCKRFTAVPVQVPCAPLPEDRIREAKVFEVIGLDLCGPLILKDGSKSWVVLFTCAIFRAIHVELVSSLSTENFLLAFRRFISRRGRPTTVFSDNGTNLVKASSELKSIDFEQLQNFASVKKINWKFNPPAAPWWGGFFERMIGMLKGILRRVLGKACLHYEELYTVLCDAESVINARPLTYISDDDDLEPLTPAMFLQEVYESSVPDIDLIDETKMRKRYAYRQKVRQDLRKRFRNEYLGQLKNFAKSNSVSDIRQGDIVLIGDDNCKRVSWPLGKIEELYPGKDKKVRVARIATKSGSLLRPLQRIYPLELCSNISIPILVESPSSSVERIPPDPDPLTESSTLDPVAESSSSDPVAESLSRDSVAESSSPVLAKGSTSDVPRDTPSSILDRDDNKPDEVVTSHFTGRRPSEPEVKDRRSRVGRPLKRPNRLDI